MSIRWAWCCTNCWPATSPTGCGGRATPNGNGRSWRCPRPSPRRPCSGWPRPGNWSRPRPGAWSGACAGTWTGSRSRPWPRTRPSAMARWKPSPATSSATGTVARSKRGHRASATACRSTPSATAWAWSWVRWPCWCCWPAWAWPCARPRRRAAKRPARRRCSAWCWACSTRPALRGNPATRPCANCWRPARGVARPNSRPSRAPTPNCWACFRACTWASATIHRPWHSPRPSTACCRPTPMHRPACAWTRPASTAACCACSAARAIAWPGCNRWPHRRCICRPRPGNRRPTSTSSTATAGACSASRSRRGNGSNAPWTCAATWPATTPAWPRR